MRPSANGEHLPFAKPRSRKSSVADCVAAQGTPSSHVPTTFFLRSEEELEASDSSLERSDRRTDNTFGVQSLADTLEAAFGPESSLGDKRPKAEASEQYDDKETASTSTQGSPKPLSGQRSISRSAPVRRHRREPSNRTLSTPQTPLNVDLRSPVPPSAMPSTPKSLSLLSLKLSDDDSVPDDTASQAIASSGDEEEQAGLEPGESNSFPQLVMPSIQMPTRRPFTTKGKAMGRLKTLVAGKRGVGKSSFIRSILQQCEDIVHVDPSTSSHSYIHAPSTKQKRNKVSNDTASTIRMTEVHASTKSYPHWWSDLGDSRTLRRRKSTSDAILERNICFIDTPGLSKSLSHADYTNFVVDYVESLLQQNLSLTSMEDSDLLAIVGGNGGVQVDLVVYLVQPGHDISVDLDCMERLSTMTNLIPVIAKSDTVPMTEIIATKTSILARLQTSAISPFFFGKSLEDALLDVQGLTVATPLTDTSDDSNNGKVLGAAQFPFTNPTYPYAISSTPGPDAENMDASLLMSPDYVQPLLPSELVTFVDQVFDPESIAWLRHLAAKKFLSWRRRNAGDSFLPHHLQQRPQRSVPGSPIGLHGATISSSNTPSVFSVASPSGVLVPRVNSPFYPSNLDSSLQSPFPASSPSLSHTNLESDGLNDFSLTRYTLNSGEQRLKEVRMAKWATDLQQSLRNERDRYEEIQRSERARWLLERVGEEVKNGNIVSSPNGSPRAEWAVVRQGVNKSASPLGQYGRSTHLDSRDPLGLCDFSDEFRKRGFILVKVLGGVSVFGAVMVATIKACGLEAALPEVGLWTWLTGGGD